MQDHAPTPRKTETTVARAAPPSFLFLVVLTSASPFALNAISPAMPRMADGFGVSYGVIQLVLTLALVAFGTAQLIVGPLSDRYGRRPVVLAGLALFTAGSFLSAQAWSPSVLILGRVLQASGGATAFVLARTIVYDTHDRDGATQTISYMVMAMVLAPMLATIIGGWMAETIGWRAIFWTISSIGAALLALTAAVLHETNPLAGTARTIAGIGREAVALLRLRGYWAYTCASAFASGMFFAFLGVAPFVVEKIMGRQPSEFGVYFVLMSIGYMAGNFVSGRIARVLGPERMLRLGVVAAVPGIALFWLLSPFVHPVAIFLPMMFLTFSNGLTLPSATVGAMAIRPQLAGTAAGVGGALQMVVAASISSAVGAIVETTATAMLVALTACWVMSALSYLAIRRLERSAHPRSD